MNLYPSGTLIANRYEVAGKPLIGGMGIVYLCMDHQIDRPVALKTFKPEYMPDRSARDRFLREGECWIKLGAHPNIVRAYNVEHIGDGREVYLVLELIAKEQGRQDASLRAWLIPGRPLSLDQALLFSLQIARGMGHATATIPGFVHRDLKPENVLVGADLLADVKVNRIRVTDFGLARVWDMWSTRHREGSMQKLTINSNSPAIGNHRALLTEGGVVGTPEYMAPEQWDSHDVDTRADFYTLGCILAEMLLGRMVVNADPRQACRELHKSGSALKVASCLPKDLTSIMAGCLSISPNDRFGSWEEVEEAMSSAYHSVSGKEAPKEEEVIGETRAERVAIGWSYNAIGMSYFDISKFGVAMEFFKRMVQIGQTEKSRMLEGAGLGNLGIAYISLGDTRRAIESYEQSLSIAHEIKDRKGEGNALGNLGNAYLRFGDARRAIGYHEQSLALAREVEDLAMEGLSLDNLGIAYISLGDARCAIDYYEQSLVIAREIGDHYSERNALSNLGSAYWRLGEAQRAIEYFEKSLIIAHENGDRVSEGNALGNLGVAYKDLGDVSRAIGYYEQSLSIAHEIGDRNGEGIVLGNLGNAYILLGDTRRAIEYQEQSLSIARDTGDRAGEANILGSLGTTYGRMGDTQREIKYIEQSLAISRVIGDMMGAAISCGNLAMALSDQGKSVEALRYAEYALREFKKVGHVQYTQMAQQLIDKLRQ